MHEIGVVRQLVRTVTEFAAQNGVTDVREVVVDCGELSDGTVIKGSVLEHAKLTIHIVPGMAECNDCDEIFNVVQCRGYCPNCGSFDKTVLTGRDFTIREIVVPEEQETI